MIQIIMSEIDLSKISFIVKKIDLLDDTYKVNLYCIDILFFSSDNLHYLHSLHEILSVSFLSHATRISIFIELITKKGIIL